MIWKAIAIGIIFLSNVVIHEAACHLYAYCSIATIALATVLILNYLYIGTIFKVHGVSQERKENSIIEDGIKNMKEIEDKYKANNFHLKSSENSYSIHSDSTNSSNKKNEQFVSVPTHIDSDNNGGKKNL